MRLHPSEWAKYLDTCHQNGVEPNLDWKPLAGDLEELPGMEEDPRWWTTDMIADHLKTSRRTILRWVSEGRLPPPKKFGKLARWPRDVIEQIGRDGVPSLPTETTNAVRGLPPGGPNCVCPHCDAILRVFIGNTGFEVEVTQAPSPAKPKKATPAKKPAAKKGKK